MRQSDSVRPLRLRLFGEPALRLPDGRDALLERRAAALLALAALEPGVSRTRAAALLWPDSADPRRNLRQQLLRFRQQFGQPLLTGEASLHLAVEHSAPSAGDGTALAPLLAGHDYADCPEFNAWLKAQRSSRREQSFKTLDLALARAEAEQRWRDAIALARQRLAQDPLSEAHHRALIRLHYLDQDLALARAAFADLCQMLSSEFAAQASAETLALMRLVERSAAPAGPAAPARVHATALLRPPRMLGRQKPLQQVRDAWAEGRVAWVLGEAGMGKSRLLAELGAGADTLAVSARPGDSAVPYATLARALRPLVAASPPLGVQRQELARVLPELALAQPLPLQGSKLALQQAVEQCFVTAAPCRVLVDDLHFADEASIDMLLTLSAAETLNTVCWLLAQRPAEGEAAVARLRDGLDEGQRLTLVPLSPLNEAQMAELVESLELEGQDSKTLADELVRHSGGNPMFALETLKARLAGTAGDNPMRSGLPRPASVGALIERRLRQLSAPALALARLAAVAGVDFDAALAQAVLSESALALADRWQELEQAQVLRGAAFAHDLVFEATLATLPQPVAASIHGEVAAVLEGRAAEPARVAAHWLAAGQGGRAVPHLVAAAQRARLRFEYRPAALHHEDAARLMQGQDEAAFDQWFEAARAWGKLAETTQLERVAALILPLARSARQLARAAWVRAHLMEFRANYEGMHDEGAQVLAHAERAGDDEMLGEGLAYAACANFWRGRPVEALPLMQRAAAHYQAMRRDDDAALWAHGAAVCQQSLGRLAEARAALESCLVEFERLGNKSMQNNTLSTLAAIAMDEGRIDDASALLQAARALLSDMDAAPDTWVPTAAASSRVLRMQGRHGQALALLDEDERRFPTGENAGLHARLDVERAWLWLELGRPHQVLRILSRIAVVAQAAEPLRWMEQTLRCTLQAAGTPAQAAQDDELLVNPQDQRGALPLRRARGAAAGRAALGPVASDCRRRTGAGPHGARHGGAHRRRRCPVAKRSARTGGARGGGAAGRTARRRALDVSAAGGLGAVLRAVGLAAAAGPRVAGRSLGLGARGCRHAAPRAGQQFR